MLSLGLDIGTTTITAVAFDTVQRQLVARTTLPNDADCTPADGRALGWAELDLSRALEIAVEALTQTIAMLGTHAGWVACLGVTGQMHGVALLGRDLRSLRPAITWQDQRAQAIIPELIERAGGAGAFANMGCLPASGYLGATLGWLQRQGELPDHAGACACFIPTAIASLLTGRPPVTDPTLAASSGCFDIVHGRWSEAVLGAWGVPPRLLPPVAEAGAQMGDLADAIARRVGLPGPISVGVPLGDHQASLIGSGCTSPGQIHVNVGTSSQISMVVDAFTPMDAEHGLETRPFPGGRYMLTGAALCGGDAFALLRRFFDQTLALFGCTATARAQSPDATADAMFAAMIAAAARIPPGADGLRVRPAFDGVRHRPGVYARISEVRRANFTPAHLARAMLEGIADELGEFYDAMRARGLAGHTLVGSGNAVRRNALLREVLSQRLGLPLRMPVWEEEAAVGAAISAAPVSL